MNPGIASHPERAPQHGAPAGGYLQRRGQIEAYFDRTAAEAWAKLTSDAPVSRVRATVRAGRERMRARLLGWLPAELHGARILDAGCGTGAMAHALAARGADVLAIDLAPTLVALARERVPQEGLAGRIDFRAGDMLDAGLGQFDFVVAMDSLIHYREADVLRALGAWAARCRQGMLFTYAPGSPLLHAAMALGRLFPRGDRSPRLEPIAPQRLARALQAEPRLADWRLAQTERVQSGFYTSEAARLLRADAQPAAGASRP
jgi:magnesium-protoporphyrin O-methyltransferase